MYTKYRANVNISSITINMYDNKYIIVNVKKLVLIIDFVDAK